MFLYLSLALTIKKHKNMTVPLFNIARGDIQRNEVLGRFSLIRGQCTEIDLIPH
jgi:hypothetical protein